MFHQNLKLLINLEDLKEVPGLKLLLLIDNANNRNTITRTVNVERAFDYPEFFVEGISFQGTPKRFWKGVRLKSLVKCNQLHYWSKLLSNMA